MRQVVIHGKRRLVFWKWRPAIGSEHAAGGLLGHLTIQAHGMMAFWNFLERIWKFLGRPRSAPVTSPVAIADRPLL
jgi:hypothetical protein